MNILGSLESFCVILSINYYSYLSRKNKLKTCKLTYSGGLWGNRCILASYRLPLEVNIYQFWVFFKNEV